MKLKRVVFLLLAILTLVFVSAQAEELQFPFLAETNELAVNLRSEMSTKSAAVGRLERGMQLNVLAEQTSAGGERWYTVELEDGTRGCIRSDLLISADVAEAERAKAVAGDRAYIGNKNTKKFHELSCRTLPAPKNQVNFSSREEAVSKGYEACKNCKP